MSKRKTKETQEVQQYQVGDTIQIKGLDYRVVEVVVDGYHVKNINPHFNSFIYVQGQPTSVDTSDCEVEDIISAAFEAAKRGDASGVVIPESMKDDTFIVNEIDSIKDATFKIGDY